MAPVNSASSRAAACIFRPLIHGVARLCTFSSRPTASRTAHRANRHLLLVLVLNVFAVGRLEGFFPILPTGVRKPGMSADNLGGRLLVRLCTKTPSRVSAPEAASLRGSACDPPFGSEPVAAHGLQRK